MVMVKKKIKFPLEMKNGEKVRTLEELKANYNIESILNYYFSGKLKVWLEQRFYKGELEQLEGLSEMAEHVIPQMLCRIFEQDFTDISQSDSENFLVKKRKMESVRQYTEDLTILENIEFVATSQEELEWILAKENNIGKAFLLGEQFVVYEKDEKVEYIGINTPTVKLNADKKFDAKKHNILFRNVILTADSEIIINAEHDLERMNTLTEKVKKQRGFEKLKHVINIENLGKEMNYNSLEINTAKVFLGEKVILIADYNPEEMIMVEPANGKLHKKFRKQNNGIEAICKTSTQELFYYDHGEFGQKITNLLSEDNKSIEEFIPIKSFYTKPNFYDSTIVGFFDGKVYSYKYDSTSYGRGSTWIEYRSYDLRTGKGSGQGKIDLPAYYQKSFNGKFMLGHFFHKGILYTYLPNERMIFVDNKKQINITEGIKEFVVTMDKIIALPKERRGWDTFNENEEGDLLVFDLNTGQKVKKIKAHKEKIELIKQFNDIFITMTGNGEIKIWDSKELSLLNTIQVPEGNFYIRKHDIDLTDEGMAVLCGGKVFIYE
jgi:hypothetical protein